MKILLIILLTILTLSVEAQKLQVTGFINIDAQWNQLTKTNDSLKTALSSVKAEKTILLTRIDSFKTALTSQKNYSAIKASQTYVLVQDTIKYKSTIRQLNHTIDSLKSVMKYKISQALDTMEFIGYSDTQTGTFTKITEKEYMIAPKFTWQILKRYPITTAQGIITKEVTITELKQ